VSSTAAKVASTIPDFQYEMPRMNTGAIVAKLNREEKELKGELARIGSVREALGRLGSARGKSIGRKLKKKYAHSLKARKAIAKSQRARWKELKATIIKAEKA
jgi:hypothetical protein